MKSKTISVMWKTYFLTEKVNPKDMRFIIIIPKGIQFLHQQPVHDPNKMW